MSYRFFPADPLDADPAPRVRHWCGSPECARCDDAANVSAALGDLHDDPTLLFRQYPEHAAELLADVCELVGRHKLQTPQMNARVGAELIRLVDECLLAAARTNV